MPWRRSLREIGRALGPFLFLLLFYSIGASADDPIISRFAETFTDNPLLIGFLVSLTWISFMLTAEPAGSIVGKLGERKTILLGGAIDALGFLIIFMADSIYIFAIAMVLGGFGSSLFWSTARTHVANISGGKTGTAFGAYIASWGVGWSIGPLIGGAMALNLGLRMPFLFSAVILGIAFILLLKLMPPDKGRTSIRKALEYEMHGGFIKDGLKFLRKTPHGVKRVLLCQVLLYAAFFVIVTFMPLHFASLNHGEIGTLFFINTILFAVSSFFWGALSDKFNKAVLAFAGSLGSAGVVMLFLGSSGFTSLFILMGVFGVFVALMEPVLDAMLNDRVDKSSRGVANGLSQAAYGLGASIGPVLGGAAASIAGLESTFVVATAIFGVSGLICSGLRK